MTQLTEIHVSQILPASAYQLIGTNSGATKDIYLSLVGTTNEVIVTNSGTSITLSTPQAIATTSSPTFTGLTLTGTLSVDGLTTLGNGTVTIDTSGEIDTNGLVYCNTLTVVGNTIVTGSITATNQTLAIKNIDITTVTSDPGSPVEGQLWYNSTTHQFVGYNGTTNVLLG